MTFWLRPLISAILASVPIAAAMAGTPVRAIFDEGMYWAGTQEEVARTLRRVKQARFNTYIPCVWHGQGATWRSHVAPAWDANPAVAERNALGKFITAAHREGIKVLPCFTLMLRQRDFFPQFASGTRPEGVFNVHNPAFRRFATDLVLEVVKSYDIDGVNLDYVRAGQVCYDDACGRQYLEAQKRNLMLDLATHKINAEAFDSIVEWQRRSVRALVSDIAVQARTIRPGLLVTVDAAPWADSVLIEGQDSLAWSEAGLVDTVFSMNYAPVIDWDLLERLQVGLAHPERFVIMVANYDGEAPEKPKSRSGVALADLVNEAAQFNPDRSFAVYIYSLLTDEHVAALAAREN